MHETAASNQAAVFIYCIKEAEPKSVTRVQTV